MARGNIVTILAFWLILISILSIPNPLQDALIIATAIGLIVISYTPKRSIKKDKVQREVKVKVLAKEDNLTKKTAEKKKVEEPKVVSEIEGEEEVFGVKIIEKPKAKGRPKKESISANNPEGLSDYTAQGVNVKLHNDL